MTRKKHFNNLVYLRICELTYNAVSKGILNQSVYLKFSTTDYNSFCSVIKSGLLTSNLSGLESKMLLRVMNRIERVFGLTDKEVSILVSDFFILEKHHQFILTVKYNEILFGPGEEC